MGLRWKGGSSSSSKKLEVVEVYGKEGNTWGGSRSKRELLGSKKLEEEVEEAVDGKEIEEEEGSC